MVLEKLLFYLLNIFSRQTSLLAILIFEIDTYLSPIAVLFEIFLSGDQLVSELLYKIIN